jgi:hypothetical protein
MPFAFNFETFMYNILRSLFLNCKLLNSLFLDITLLSSLFLDNSQSITNTIIRLSSAVALHTGMVAKGETLYSQLLYITIFMQLEG